MNNFTFNGGNYLQVGGTAMGTRLAPSYANLFMGQLEEKLLRNSPYKPKLYLRYIDDIFLIFTGSQSELDEFIRIYEFTTQNNKVHSRLFKREGLLLGHVGYQKL